MERKIKADGRCERTPLAVPTDQSLQTWLTAQANAYDLRWLLVHADNGIIWGELRNGALILSCDVFADPGLHLDPLTLQQARLFGETGELRLWQGARGLQASLCQDDRGAAIAWIDEDYLLWGTQSEQVADGFSVLVEGAQGIAHAPPLSASVTERQRARMRVRHYLEEDADGVVRIVDSRLVELLGPATKEITHDSLS